MGRTRRRRAGAFLVACCLCAAGLALPATAQFSPGPLSRPHAVLEGNSRCLDCHASGEGVLPEKCLECHQPLRERIDAGRGLHASSDYADCKTCHIEHSGVDFELIWWGETGRDAFDHGLTGYELSGAHRSVACRDCHRARNIAQAELLAARGKSLDRTFLGLSAQSCLDCHEDHHRGEFAADSCLRCHTDAAWKPASAFDHDRTAFPLTGLHQRVDCGGCHRQAGAPEGELRFAGLRHSSCTDCHRDQHDGRFGADCTRCHSTAGWKAVSLGSFDHRATRFPLRGRHQQAECTACHRPGAPYRGLSFARCSDCHSDPHRGQFTSRDRASDCADCHTVDDFLPSTFGLSRHQEGPYPLEGSHLAVPCLSCHTTVAPGELGLSPTRSASGQPRRVTRFRFPSTECTVCHRDPHEGETERWQDGAGCTTCHSLATWRRVSFDHDRTGFPLVGRHSSTPCGDCHRADGDEAGLAGRPFRGLSTACAACHQDPHAGQFDGPAGPADCRTCHTPADWSPNGFDHDRDARFALQGGHAGVACLSCHRRESRDGREFTRFKPLTTACVDCHDRP